MVSVPEENESDMDNWSSQQFDFFYLQNNHIRQRRFVLEKADNNPDKFTRNQEKLRSLTGIISVGPSWYKLVQLQWEVAGQIVNLLMLINEFRYQKLRQFMQNSTFIVEQSHIPDESDNSSASDSDSENPGETPNENPEFEFLKLVPNCWQIVSYKLKIRHNHILQLKGPHTGYTWQGTRRVAKYTRLDRIVTLGTFHLVQLEWDCRDWQTMVIKLSPWARLEKFVKNSRTKIQETDGHETDYTSASDVSSESDFGANSNEMNALFHSYCLHF